MGSEGKDETERPAMGVGIAEDLTSARDREFIPEFLGFMEGHRHVRLDIQRDDWQDFADELGIRKQGNFSRYSWESCMRGRNNFLFI